MIRSALIACCFLFSGPLYATFELEDPAADAMKEAQGLKGADRPCGDFLQSRQEGSDDYWDDLKWLIGHVHDSGRQLGMEYDPDAAVRWIGDYCGNAPSASLAAAAEAYLRSGSEQP